MKLVKMSLAAVMVLGTSAFAIDNVKVSGDAKLFYHTTDADYAVDPVNQPGVTSSGMFDQGASAADTALRLGVTADLVKGVSFGATAYAVSTLGLENNLVANTWTGAHANGNGTLEASDTDDAAWIGELWLAGTMGNTTLKAGRIEIDTPFAFSEKWSIVPNTFEGAVLINQDLPDTTLVAAWIGKSNGVNAVTLNVADVGLDGFLAPGAKFNTFASGGAYAAGIVNNSFKPLTAQAWYYNVQNVADAYWLQADIDCQLVKGLKIGAQYGAMDPKGNIDLAVFDPALAGLTIGDLKDSSAYAFKLAYEGIEGLTVSAAYSEADKDGTLKIANVGTNNMAFAQSKLYTEAWWNYGLVGEAGSETYNLTALYEVGDVVSLGAFYTSVDNDTKEYTMDEITLSATKSFGPLDVSLVYINQDYSSADADNIVQAYLTLNF